VEIVRGQLGPPGNQEYGGRFANRHSFTVPAGQRLTVSVTSSEFDTQLFARSPSGRSLHNDDVTSGNTNSSLLMRGADAGQWQFVVTSYQVGERGSYELRVETSPDDGGPITRPGGGPRAFGIFVGIDDYGGAGNLQECANDAIKLAQTLREGGIQTEDQQVVLTDGAATPQAVRGAFQRVASQAGPDDIFVFFYSGHGGQGNAGSRDAREIDGRDEYLHFPNGQITDDEMATLYDGVRAKVAMIALDSCHSGGFAKDVITRPGRMGYFSSEEDLTSATALSFQAGGYLSLYLRNGIRGGADAAPSDGRVTAGELSHYLFNEFGAHVTNVESEGHGGRAFQHLVVDRGAVTVDTLLFAYR
jgi:hypothetical protein